MFAWIGPDTGSRGGNARNNLVREGTRLKRIYWKGSSLLILDNYNLKILLYSNFISQSTPLRQVKLVQLRVRKTKSFKQK